MSLTRLFARLRRDRSGTTTIEIAIILPVLLMFVFGIMQMGMIFQGQAGMAHALGEGARLATIYPTPADDIIKSKMETSVFKSANFGTYTVSDPVRNGLYLTLNVKYVMPMKFFMVNLPDITLQKQKIVYTASKLS
jgi:Flp pilus assembly protein TadG